MSGGPKPITVLLVDDHAIVRQGYRSLLANAADIEVVAEAESGEMACKAYIDANPGVVIMDLSLPGIGGLGAIRRMISRDPDARVLVFSMHEDMVFVEQALQAGARGYITKTSASEILVEAVRQIAAGEIYLHSEIAQRLAFQRVRGRNTPFAALSTREFEIFCLLAEGAKVNQIAKRLSLSYKTVANYSTEIKNKLGVSTTTELARLAIRRGLVDV